MIRFGNIPFSVGVRSAWKLSAVVRSHGGLLLLLLLALVVRASLFVWSYGFPTGDVWNFVGIADALSRFDYPENEKRLPFYPFLILLFHTVAPWFSWEGIALFIALVASLVALALLYFIGRALGLRKTPLLVVLLLIMSFRPFLVASLRGYADMVFLVLLLGSVLALLRLPSGVAMLLLGPLISLLALTRYEGVAAGGILLLIALVRLRHQALWAAVLILLAVLTMSPYVALMRAHGRSLLPVAYLEEARTTSYGVESASALLRNYWTIWERQGLFEVGKVPLGFLRYATRDPLGLPTWLADLVREPREAAALLAIIGFAFLLWRRLTSVVTVAAPFFATAVPVAWYAPLERYDLFFFPLVALGAGAGLHVAGAFLARATTADRAGTTVRRGGAAAVLLVAIFVWMLAQTQQSQRGVEKHRGFQRAYYDAVHFTRHLSARKIALETENSLTNLYFRRQGLYKGNLFRAGMRDEERWEALRAAQVDLVITTTQPEAQFAFVRRPVPTVLVEELRHFTSVQQRGPLDDVVVYRLGYVHD